MKKSALLGAFIFSTLFACQNGDEAATATPEESTQVMNHSAKGYQLYTVREALTEATPSQLPCGLRAKWVMKKWRALAIRKAVF